MNFRNRINHDVPALNTSSLPDLIFTVLFFFMVVTHMRSVTLKVRFRVPQGTELTRLTKKTAVSHVYIGVPSGKVPSGAPSYKGCIVQINDKYASPDEVAAYVKAEKKRMSPDDRLQQTISIKADRNTPMELITDVKMALRQANARKISYSAEKKK